MEPWKRQKHGGWWRIQVQRGRSENRRTMKPPGEESISMRKKIKESSRLSNTTQKLIVREP